MSTKIIIDSASDISADEANKMGVILLPMQITFKDGEFLDGFDISPKEFYEKLEKLEDLPKTSQVNGYRFREEYEKVVNNGDDVIVITISSKLSGTFSSALLASKQFKDKIFVIVLSIG